MLTFAQGAQAQARNPQPPSLYERIADKLAKDPKLAAVVGQPPAELEQVRWLVGSWTVTARVFATSRTPESVEHGEQVVEPILGGSWLSMRDTYPTGTQDQGFLTFNPVTRTWVSLALDSTGNAVTSTSSGWSGNRLVLTADEVVILGETVTLRQTLEKKSDREYRLLNEERLPTGEWVPLDEYVYTRKAAPN